MRPLVDGNLGYRPEAKILAKPGADIHLRKALQPFAREAESRSTTYRGGENIWLTQTVFIRAGRHAFRLCDCGNAERTDTGI
jgi:hypothetical protein